MKTKQSQQITQNSCNCRLMIPKKKSLNIFKKTEIVLSSFSDYNGMKHKENKKPTNTWRLNNFLLNNEWMKMNKLKQKSSNTWKQMKTKIQQLKICGTHKRGCKSEVCSNIGYPKKQE